MYFVRLNADNTRSICLRTARGVQQPKSATRDGKRVNLLTKRTPAQMHALCRMLNTPVEVDA
jgi:hypothetical protein